jgi:N-methylhydantoinase B
MTNLTRIQRSGGEEILPGKFSHVLVRPGEAVTFLTAGGGGYGDAWRRDHAAMSDDVKMGYVSPRNAD